LDRIALAHATRAALLAAFAALAALAALLGALATLGALTALLAPFSFALSRIIGFEWGSKFRSKYWRN